MLLPWFMLHSRSNPIFLQVGSSSIVVKDRPAPFVSVPRSSGSLQLRAGLAECAMDELGAIFATLPHVTGAPTRTSQKTKLSPFYVDSFLHFVGAARPRATAGQAGRVQGTDPGGSHVVVGRAPPRVGN